ncbi:pentatricopeptide repeat-containing protein At5g42450, mitochondrial-like isoform X2 [Gastrolobium bilobum]|uniref:pentatricopeptide repeat-containing protein At5g42450, mitochondrial-like isoform X2 n=1 Tax=Gastrolobium bilobum TaxID=150636 RepID=UPI002AB25FD7|nr:pentatricopeptide repeat-containing protein At5g42450, mitochondrial-like isoform X2 [Gastrolobium bilobum]
MKTHMKNVVSRLSVAQSTWITPHVVSCSYVTETHHAHATKHETTVVQADSHSYGSVSTTFQVACHMFEEMSDLTVASATTIIGGFAKRHCHEDAIYLFSRMLASIIRPNEFTFGTVLHSSTNVVSWNAMVGGCSQTGHNEEAVNFFIDMLKEGFIPNESTFPCVICAAANIASLGIGKSFHACAIKFLGKLDGFVGNSLISFYAKCGNMEDSLLMFDKLFKRNIVSWNAVICGYAQNGRGNEAISFFKRMGSTGCKPNEVTLLGLLWACNHAGLVDEGYSYFNQARLESPSLLKPEHYACMVDLLARSGRFTEAECFLHSVPFDPGIGFWKAILGGCQIHSNKELGELAARKILALDPDDVSSYVMLSNAHSAAGRWSDVSKLRTEMKEKGMKRIPGSSWIEIRGKVHVFLTADQNHDEIYVLLRYFFEHLRENEASNLLNIFLHCSV